MRHLCWSVVLSLLVTGVAHATEPLTEDDFSQLLEELESERVLEQKREEIEQIRARRRTLAGESETTGTTGTLRLIRLLGTRERGLAEFSQGELVYRVRVGERLADGSQLVALRAGGAELRQPDGATRIVMLGAAAEAPSAAPPMFAPAPAPRPASVPPMPVTAAGGGSPK